MRKKKKCVPFSLKGNAGDEIKLCFSFRNNHNWADEKLYFLGQIMRAFKKDIFRIENLYYNSKEDYFVCPMGQHMKHIGMMHGKTDSGYRTESYVYRAQRCEGCPLRWGCYKRKHGNREIEVNHRLMEYKRKA